MGTTTRLWNHLHSGGILKFVPQDWWVFWETSWMWWVVGNWSYCLAPFCWCWGVPCIPWSCPLHLLYLRRYTQAFSYFLTNGLCCIGNLLDALWMDDYIAEINDDIEAQLHDPTQKKIGETEAVPELRTTKCSYIWMCVGLPMCIPLHHLYLGRFWQAITYCFTCGCFGCGYCCDTVFMMEYTRVMNEQWGKAQERRHRRAEARLRRASGNVTDHESEHGGKPPRQAERADTNVSQEGDRIRTLAPPPKTPPKTPVTPGSSGSGILGGRRPRAPAASVILDYEGPSGSWEQPTHGW